MNPQAMDLHGAALLDFFQGDTSSELIIRRDDGLEGPLPISHFFRKPAEFSNLEKSALDLCRGRILDVGAGAGVHSLVLQGRGYAVTAIDISPQAIEVIRRHGVQDVLCVDIFQFRGGPFDTLLMLDHGIGMVETLAGLDHFLQYAPGLLNADGQILVDSLDVRLTEDPQNLAYHEANRQAGRYIGEVRTQFTYKGQTGPFFGWLHVDSETLANHAEKAGWGCEVIIQRENGDYLARLTKLQAA